MDVPFRVAIIGLGGFARAHHRAIVQLEAEGLCRLAATCDINPAANADFQAELDLAGRGVPVYDDYLKMLEAHDGKLDLVTIPTPIPLHRVMHRESIRRGIPVYLEKPPTLDFRELAAMLEEERAAAKATYVGFNWIIQAERRALKERLVAGEFGELRSVSLRGCWPRPESYFARNNWAGRLRQGQQLVLDSVMGNAMSHFVHNALFWCGHRALNAWGEPATATAELYRAKPIEGLDTVFCRAEIVNGPQLRIALTHACRPADTACEETCVADRATLYFNDKVARITWRDGRVEETPVAEINPVIENLRAHIEYLAGKRVRPITLLADCEPFVTLYDLCFVSADGITEVPAAYRDRKATEKDGDHIAIRDIVPVGREFGASGRLPSEQGCAWARAGQPVTPADLPRLPGLIDRLCPA